MTAESGRRGAVTTSGPHLVLIALYGIFILAAGARSAVQISTKFHTAPLAYILSAVAACTYVAGLIAIRRAAAGRPAMARVTLWLELGGVFVIGTLSWAHHSWFPDATVWSDYGGPFRMPDGSWNAGYAFVPAVLPILGIWWLHRRTASDA